MYIVYIYFHFYIKYFINIRLDSGSRKSDIGTLKVHYFDNQRKNKKMNYANITIQYQCHYTNITTILIMISQ